jgi:serpin B
VKLGPVDFQKPETAQLINEWADHSTRGKIKDVVSWPFDPLTQVVLASAIYFKGQWLCPFDKSQTKPQSFHLADGKEIPVPMMRQDGEFSYQENKDFQAVSLGYVGWKQDMYILLPGKNSNLKQLLARFNGETWQNTIHPHFEYRKGRLVLPKFKLEYDVKLNAPLQALGMKRAFSNGSADFSAMSDESLFISEVKQKSFVEVNETGTEAAAISQASISKGGSRNPPRPFEMIVDRPFFFVIEDDKTQSILFMGMVYDPAGQGGGG